MENVAPYAESRAGPNRIALLKDGDQTYSAMLTAIAEAKQTIVLETYILRDDLTGSHFLEALCTRARAGVEVMVMFDFWGSGVSEATMARIRADGVKVHVFRPWRYMGSISRAFNKVRRRNHRKALVIDGRIGFTGGLNISNDYASKDQGGRGWRDTHMRIVGPEAVTLERLFLQTWHANKGGPYDYTKFIRPTVAGCSELRILNHDFAEGNKPIRRAYEQAFARSKYRISVTNAYFLPPARLIAAMVAARKRGVNVEIILAGTTDVPLILYAARGLYAKLLRSGIRVFEWSADRVLHAKTAVVDDIWATVGSTNLDPLSLRQNLELNAIIIEPKFAEALQVMFEADLKDCREITLDQVRRYGVVQRVLSWVAFKLRHWL